MRKSIALDNFSEGMKGRTGQFKSLSVGALQDIKNFYVGRDNSLIQRSGLESTGIKTLPTDKVLSFVKNNKRYYVVYDTLLKNKFYHSGNRPSTFMGVNGALPTLVEDVFDPDLGIMNVLGRFKVGPFETFNENDPADVTRFYNLALSFIQSLSDSNQLLSDQHTAYYNAMLYNAISMTTLPLWLGLPFGDRAFTFDSGVTRTSTYPLDIFNPSPLSNNYLQSDLNDTSIWWQRFLVYDEEGNIISKRIERMFPVSEDSGEVRDYNHGMPNITLGTGVENVNSRLNLPLTRQQAYGISEHEYRVNVGEQGVWFYSPSGKLPPMYLLLNSSGETDGVVRDSRSMYARSNIFTWQFASYMTEEEFSSTDEYSGFIDYTNEYTVFTLPDTEPAQGTNEYTDMVNSLMGFERIYNGNPLENSFDPVVGEGQYLGITEDGTQTSPFSTIDLHAADSPHFNVAETLYAPEDTKVKLVNPLLPNSVANTIPDTVDPDRLYSPTIFYGDRPILSLVGHNNMYLLTNYNQLFSPKTSGTDTSFAAVYPFLGLFTTIDFTTGVFTLSTETTFTISTTNFELDTEGGFPDRVADFEGGFTDKFFKSVATHGNRQVLVGDPTYANKMNISSSRSLSFSNLEVLSEGASTQSDQASAIIVGRGHNYYFATDDGLVIEWVRQLRGALLVGTSDGLWRAISLAPNGPLSIYTGQGAITREADITFGSVPSVISLNTLFHIPRLGRELYRSEFLERLGRNEFTSMINNLKQDYLVNDEITEVTVNHSEGLLLVRTVGNRFYIGTVFVDNIAWAEWAFENNPKYAFLYHGGIVVHTNNEIFLSRLGASEPMEGDVRAMVKLQSPSVILVGTDTPHMHTHSAPTSLSDGRIYGKLNGDIRAGSDNNPYQSSRKGEFVTFDTITLKDEYDSTILSFEGAGNIVSLIKFSMEL